MKYICDKQSLGSRIFNNLLVLSFDKFKTKSIKATERNIKRSSNKAINYRIYKDFNKEEIEDIKFFSYNGTLKNNTGKILLYVHGGTFVERANSFQIKFAKKIAKMTNSTLLIPMYELLPNGNSVKLMQLLENFYYNILENNYSEINLLGDSAGGGAILAFSMIIRDKKLTMPKNLIMVSPWLDLSMTNPDLVIDEKKDKMNAIAGIKHAGKLWAGNLDVKNPQVSPMYGTFENLPRMSIIFGGKGILTSECQKFCSILDSQRIDYNYIFYSKEGHDFAAFPTKEADEAISMIADILN